MRGQYFLVDPGLVVEALGEADGGELHEVSVALLVFGQEYEVPVLVAVFGAGFFAARGAGHVEFGADDGVHALGPAGFFEFEGAEHVAMVGQGDAGHAQGLGARGQALYRRRAVEQREIRMVVEVDKFSHSVASIIAAGGLRR